VKKNPQMLRDKEVNAMAKRRGSLVRKSEPISQERSTEELQERIRKLAYEFYELRGREEAGDLADWLKAESELTVKSDRQ